ncbi:MAG: hypothetical protein B7Z60_01140 [Ferrovum sp. 37-45-19]|jgi:hypothetical protein|uniref:hypothetical protein n=1 Tax=Ferrovum sp. JA12 TaxID=1356299 RepID=UPI000702C92F|nr:hypothetical protein [Ferrovum sp. JA12]OYV80622.1 MAG: hypothetical protein B7Z65_00025 [Ferrovum sp. 21-44-67]OYV95173.1 MAG: hypothetical protein B7Z60_01140 [Ferrovum sp. 37-45-19]OZB33802.1 MAG: hypothetical protein B7X47_03550 [Ferrovum sp. 34-44-207]HQT80670.1 hypothetical protein [Ferrovaceae bacterium]KRH79758.1 hypothetical protein FERRO_08340 [Ferrovum sp. JA12]
MSVKKTNSKLAQGVRQVMEQGKTLDLAKHKVAAKTSESMSKLTPAKTKIKDPVRDSDANYEILHPERIWPD